MLKIYTAIVTLIVNLSVMAQQSALQRGFATVPVTTKSRVRSPSMQNYPASDKAVQQLADELWGKSTEKLKNIGKGTLLNGITIEEAFQLLNTVPDVAFNADSILYTHRTTNEGEFYFISNQANKTVNFSPDFRVTGKQPSYAEVNNESTRVRRNQSFIAAMQTGQ